MKFNPQRILRVLALVIGVLIVGLYIGLPAVMGIAALFPAKETVGAPPEGFTAASMRTEDGVTLAGW